MSNLDIWNKVSRPPAAALKAIQAGRLKGMTDVNPQWRIKVMTEVFGPCGEGWYYDIVKFWTEPGAQGELMAFAHIHLFTKKENAPNIDYSDEMRWSAPISGIGGSALVAKETAGLRANDEAYKMAVTDALSVAMKQLGVAADIYAGLWDGSKYKDEPKPLTSAKSVSKDVWDSLSVDEQNFLTGIAIEITAALVENKMEEVLRLFYKNNLGADEQTALWSRLDSKQRSSIKVYKDSLQKEAA